MEIKSENLKEYIINNSNIRNRDIEIEDINKLKSLNINGLNNRLEEALFVPQELSYFKEIEECSFSSITITNEIIENINKLNKLEIIEYDFCKNTAKIEMENKVKRIYLNYSNIELLNLCKNIDTMEKIFLKNIENVDIRMVCKFKNVKNIYLLNCNVINIESLEELEKLEFLKVIGSKIDNYETIEKLSKSIKVEYSEDE